MVDPDRTETSDPSEPAQSGLALWIVRSSWIGTACLAVTATLAAVAPDPFAPLAVAVALSLFCIGVGAFVCAYAVAVGRSRSDAIGMGGLFFLAGSAPKSVQRSLIVSLLVEVIVAIATASVWLVASSHFSQSTVNPLAFGLLAPMYGLGVMGLWGAKFGTFPVRG